MLLSRRPPAVAWWRSLCVLPTLVLCTGCYEYTPLRVAAAPTGKGLSLELLLNDRGRADLSDRLGPDALSLEGLLVQRDESSYAINVQSVSYFNRASSKWTGERLTVTTGQLRDVREKRLSRGKTGLAIGGAIGALVAFVVTRSILIGGESSTPGGPGTPIDQ